MTDESAPPPAPVGRGTTQVTPAPDTSGTDAPAPAEPTKPAEPALTGVELQEIIGGGGMGVVYRARDTDLNRDVAVKVLKDTFKPDSPAARRFLEEAQITGQLQHPGIPPVHRVGALTDGRPFLMMKLIKGRTLHALLADRTHPADDLARFVALFEKVCLAVGYAHRRAVVHRDLKPANIMVGSFGEVQVMDWGLAKVVGAMVPPDPGAAPETVIRSARELGTETRVGSVLGSLAYMPPEQAGGEVTKIDPRTDVFGLGAVLCSILTGKPPYVGTNFNELQLAAIRCQTADALARLAACGADPDLITLAKQCLAADPADRPADASELAAAIAGFNRTAEHRVRQAELDRARAEEKAEWDRVRTAEKAREHQKQRRVQFALLVSVAGLALLATFAWWRDARRAEYQLVQEQGRDRREFEAEKKVEVAFLLGACESALRAENAPQAEIALRAAELLCHGIGTDALNPRIERCRADLAALVALIAIDERFKTDWDKPPPARARVVADLRTALAGTGCDFGALPPDEIARRLDVSTIRSYIVYICDLWEEVAEPAELREVRRATGEKWSTYRAESIAYERRRHSQSFQAELVRIKDEYNRNEKPSRSAPPTQGK